jgi:hypothetical protein
MDERRTFNTQHRECWNAPIHHILKSIDNHTRLWIKTGDEYHKEEAELLRSYIHRLKTWIHNQEKNESK